MERAGNPFGILTLHETANGPPALHGTTLGQLFWGQMRSMEQDLALFDKSFVICVPSYLEIE